MRRAVLAAALAGVFMLVPSMAEAQEYPIPPVSITVDDNTLAPGQVFTATAHNFSPNNEVFFEINPPLGSDVADLSGEASVTGPVPDGVALGFHDVCATGPNFGGVIVTTCTTVEVSDAFGAGFGQVPPGTVIPRTGASDSTMPTARLGALLVAAGGLAVLSGRKLRARRASLA